LRILVVSDAWHPQVNGVVRTMETVLRHLRAGGDVVEVIGPGEFRSLPSPGYAEIRLAVLPGRRLRALVDGFAPEAVHIATEGPLGWAMRRLCLARGWAFTSSFHTRFPDYLRVRTGIPVDWSWGVMRRFHAASDAVLTATSSLERELATRGFGRMRRWSRGVDLERFRPREELGGADVFAGLARPVFLYAGRLAVEKNVAAFLSLDLPGTKVVVGDGPQRVALQRRFPRAVFTGYCENGALAASYAWADAFVFPSRTDTFGLVLLEALGCGTPVAAFPVSGPLDVIGDAPVGALDEDLRAACLQALEADRGACRRHAEGFSWAACAARFREALVPLTVAAMMALPAVASQPPSEAMVPPEAVALAPTSASGLASLPAAGLAPGSATELAPSSMSRLESRPVAGLTPDLRMDFARSPESALRLAFRLPRSTMVLAPTPLARLASRSVVELASGSAAALAPSSVPDSEPLPAAGLAPGSVTRLAPSSASDFSAACGGRLDAESGGAGCGMVSRGGETRDESSVAEVA
jgi:glycosyltransferase involved in cell wall biosynthesis